MKSWLILMALSASNLLGSIDGEIGGLKQVISEGDPRKINQALVALQLAINQMEPVDSPVDAPSAARIQARQNIQQKIAPIKNELIALTKNPDLTVAQTATTVLGSAGRSVEIYNALKDNLQNTKSPGVAASSLLALSKSGLMDDEIEAIAANRIGEYQSGANPDLALNLIRTAAFVPVPKATNELIEIIKSDNRVGTKMTAANAIMKLGPAGAEALPELEKFLLELEHNGGDFRDINTIKRTIMHVSGRGSVSNVNTLAASAAQTTPVPAAGTPATERTSSPGFPVAPAVIFLTVVVGILVCLLRRKSV